MREVKIFHEAPLCLFDKVQEVTDGDYALVHLLEADQTYREKFLEADDREIILDNSAFELGKSFEADKFASWVDALGPDTYVVPDVVGSASDTLDSFTDWIKKYKGLEGKKMGVLQGNSIHEATNTFKQLKALGADVIGIPHLVGYRWMKRVEATKPDPMELMHRRVALIDTIWNYCERHPIHLLGVALPQEGRYYHEMDWIESVDTSNPVVHGMFAEVYTVDGLLHKRSNLLADMIHMAVEPYQEAVVFNNISQFRHFWRRSCV